MRAYAVVVASLFIFTGVFGWVVSHDLGAANRRVELASEVRRLETALQAYEDHVAAYRTGIVELRARRGEQGDAATASAIRECRRRLGELEPVRDETARRLEAVARERRSHSGWVFEFD